MKTLLVIILVLIPSMAMSWDSKDTYYQGAVVSALLIDMGQTLHIADNPNKYYEMNPLLGKHPSKEQVVGYFMGGIVAHTLIAMALPQDYRRVWQCVWIGIEGAVIYNNYNIGVKIAW
jgi:hypothetical protein